MDRNREAQAEVIQTQDDLILKLRISLKGRPIRTLSFAKSEVTIGRDPEADVTLDNPGISRHHLRLEKMPDGYVAEDLASANGTYVNDVMIERRFLEADDVVRVGKFSLWVEYEHDKRGSEPKKPVSPIADQGTTVMSTAELTKMMTNSKDSGCAPQREVASQALGSPLRKPRNVTLLTIFACVLGVALGSAVTWFLIN